MSVCKHISDLNFPCKVTNVYHLKENKETAVSSSGHTCKSNETGAQSREPDFCVEGLSVDIKS